MVKDNKDKNVLSYDFSFFDIRKSFLKKTYKYTFLNLFKNIFNFIKYKSKILCTGKEALVVHKIVEKILSNAK
jgi:hypothetical protein